MMGGDSLKVVEILSTIEYVENSKDGICFMLINEPDSPIYSDFQLHLMEELKSHKESQIYITRRNDCWSIMSARVSFLYE